MAVSADIRGIQHYVQGIGHPKTETNSEAPPAMVVTNPLTGEIALSGGTGAPPKVTFLTDVGTGRSVSSGFTGGATPWTRLFGPNELRQAPWGASGELTNPSVAWKYVTAASASNGPAMFRKEGASIWIDGSVVLSNTGAPNYGNINTSTAGIAAGALLNTTIAILVYVHRSGPATNIRLRLGSSSSNYVFYNWATANGELVEGWNTLIVSTAEPIGAGGDSPAGQHSFQSTNSTPTPGLTDGWRVGAGSFSFASAINYAALEFTGITARTSVWFEGVYTGGKDKAQITLGFDIQGSGLDLAKSTMDKYGLVGYAAVPTANANPANPQYLWSSTDVARMQSLFLAGWDIVQHSVSHNSFGTLSDDAMLLSEYEVCREHIKALGANIGADLYTSPNNSYSNRTVALGARAAIKWMRHGVNAPLLLSRGLTGFANPLIQGSISIANTDNQVSQANEIARRLAFLDLLIMYGVSGHIYTHAIQTGASDTVATNVVVFDAICAGIAQRVAAGLLDVLAPSTMLRGSNTPNLDVVLAAPNRIAITAGASPFDLINTGYKPLRFAISGGTVSAITMSRDGVTFDSVGAQVSGLFDVNPGDRLRITYTVAPTIIQYSI